MQYKLKKKYPTLPQCWEEGMLIDLADSKLHYTSIAAEYRKHYLCIFDVENNPDYWEKFDPKNYEILSFMNSDNRGIYEKDRLGNYEYAAMARSLDFCIKYYVIHSVRRLSDDKVFTIGDSVKLERDSRIYKINVLKLTYLNCIYVYGKSCSSSFVRYLDKILVYDKRFVLTTEDNVDIFEGDSCYFTSVNSNVVFLTPSPEGIKGGVYFADREQALTYLLFKKKCLSLNDVLSVWDRGDVGFRQRLIDLVKEK